MINDLPVELLLNIFQYLDIPSLLECADVNCRFRDVLKPYIVSRFLSGDLPSWRTNEVTNSTYKWKHIVLSVKTHELVSTVDPVKRTLSLNSSLKFLLVTGNVLLGISKNGQFRVFNPLTLDEVEELEEIEQCQEIEEIVPLNLRSKKCYRIVDKEDFYSTHDTLVCIGKLSRVILLGDQESPLPFRLTRVHTISGDWSESVNTPSPVVLVNNGHMSFSTVGVPQCFSYDKYILYREKWPVVSISNARELSFNSRIFRFEPRDDVPYHQVRDAAEEIDNLPHELKERLWKVFRVLDSPVFSKLDMVRFLRPGLAVAADSSTMIFLVCGLGSELNAYRMDIRTLLDGEIRAMDVAGSLLFIGTDQGSLFLFRVEELFEQFEPILLGRLRLNGTSRSPVECIAAAFVEEILICAVSTAQKLITFQWIP